MQIKYKARNPRPAGTGRNSKQIQMTQNTKSYVTQPFRVDLNQG